MEITIGSGARSPLLRNLRAAAVSGALCLTGAAQAAPSAPPTLWIDGAHGARITTESLSPDGKTLATASDDGTIKLWSPATGRYMRTIAIGNQTVTGLAFSPDSKTLYAAAFTNSFFGGSAGAVEVVRVSDGVLADELLCESIPVSISISSNGASLAVGEWAGSFLTYDTTGEVEVWSLATRSFAFAQYVGLPVNDVAFSPDSTSVAAAEGSIGSSGDTGYFDIYRASDSARTSHVNVSGSASAVTFSKDGKTLIGPVTSINPTTLNESTALDTYTISTKALTVGGTPAGPAGRATLSPDGATIAMAEDSEVELWKTSTGELLGAIRNGANAVQFSADSADIFLCGVYFTPDTGQIFGVKEFGLSDLKVVKQIAPVRSPGVLAYTSNGGSLLCTDAYGGSLQIRSSATGAQTSVAPIPNGMTSAFSPTGPTMVAWTSPNSYPLGSPQILLYNWATKTPIKLLTVTVDSILNMQFSPTGSAVFGAVTVPSGLFSVTKIVRVDAKTGAITYLFSLDGSGFDQVAFAPNGSMVATAQHIGGGFVGYTSLIEIWSMSAHRVVAAMQVPTGPISALSFSNDSKMLAASTYTGLLKVWSAPAGTILGGLATHQVLTSLAFSPDGKKLVVGGTVYDGKAASYTGCVDVLRTADWTVAGSWYTQALGTYVYALAVKPDNSAFSLYTGDGQIRTAVMPK